MVDVFWIGIGLVLVVSSGSSISSGRKYSV